MGRRRSVRFKPPKSGKGSRSYELLGTLQLAGDKVFGRDKVYARKSRVNNYVTLNSQGVVTSTTGEVKLKIGQHYGELVETNKIAEEQQGIASAHVDQG